MSINIKTTNISAETEAEQYLMKKLESLNKLVDFNADNVTAHAELGKTTNHHKSGDIFRAELNLKMGKASFRSVSEKEDIHAAIDAMKDQLAQEIKTEKDKHLTNIRKGGAEIKNMARETDAVAENSNNDDLYSDDEQ